MAKMADIRKQLETTAQPRVVALDRPTPEAKPSARAGKDHVGAHLPPGFKDNLLFLKARTRKSMESLIAEALNDLFQKYDLPVVDL